LTESPRAGAANAHRSPFAQHLLGPCIRMVAPLRIVEREGTDMFLSKTIAVACVLCLAVGAGAQPPEKAPAAPGVLALVEPVRRVGDTRLLFPTATLGFTPDGKTLLAAGYSTEGNLLVVDVATGAPRGRLQGHEGYVNQFAFSPDS